MNDQALYNSRNIKVYMEYLGTHYPDLDAQTILDYAGMTIYQLNDGGHWFNQTQIDRFYEMVVRMTRNPNIGLEVGRFAPFSKAAGAMTHYVAGFINPKTAYSVVAKLYNQVSRACLLQARALKSNQAEITVRLKPGVEEKLYQCENRWGALEGISKLLTGRFPHIDHPVCMHKEGDCCRYIITWEPTRSSLWKRIGTYTALVSLVIVLALFIGFANRYAFAVSSVALLLILGAFMRASVLEKEELKDLLESRGDAAELLLDQVNTRYSNAVLIKEIGQYVSSALDTELLLKYLLSALEKNLEFSRGMVMLANGDRTRLEFTAGYGYSPEDEDFLKKTEFSLANPHSRGAFVVSFHKQTPFLVNDLREIEQDLSPRSLDFTRKMGSRSFICVPITYEGRSEGILAVDNLRSDRPLNETDISLLMGIAPQIGISINNARIYEKLQEREKRFRILAESAPDIIFTLDNDGKLLYVNPAWKRILGHPADAVVSLPLTAFVDEQDSHRLVQLLKGVRENRETLMDALLTIPDCSGIEHNFSFNCAPNIDGEGRVDSLVGIFKDMTDLRRSEVELKKSYQKLQLAMSSTISVISLIAESRDPYTAGHQRRVADLAAAIAREMELSEERVTTIHMAGLIHDIGKINVPAEILSKPGKLNSGEFALIKNHPETGYNILDKVDFTPPIAQIVYQHHETMDGSGYPRGIVGRDIILEARIITVADVVEAMASHRPYRPALGIEKALDEIRTHRGVTYDPDVADACIALFTSGRFHFKDPGIKD
ncbi:MAG: HD domain-containing protein [Syntrophales bacterium]|nr:HD domain-containing protein [Syntrophales bacterium]HOG07950.1 HD domain-containing protein [Syntrophales bacterium]HPB69406.1 HD domain-containing protein [Syntrophales bacterium]HQN25667.1 HD domain-containing protein [Syntrophales bacterium]HQP28068.1 HD domain-containing protein [Syntrophales bacterium]